MNATDAVRLALKNILRSFVADPLLNAREKDFQGELFAELRRLLPEPVPVTFTTHHAPPRHHSWQDPRTSRVHMEMCFGRKGRRDESVRADIVILKSGPVTLSCSVDGPTDIQESLREEDVEVVIELKAAPSQNGAEARKFLLDIEKLSALQARSPHLKCFLLIVDKSVSLDTARSSSACPRDWERDADVRFGQIIEVGSDPSPLVEVWSIDPSTKRPRMMRFDDVPDDDDDVFDPSDSTTQGS